MNKDFLKANWIYIALVCIIALVNIMPHFAAKEKVEPEKLLLEESPGMKKEKPGSLFVDFDLARDKSAKIERILKNNLPLYLFYISLNMAIVLLFFSGLTIDGYFLFKRWKKDDIFKRDKIDPPLWKISEVFKIVILALTFGYIFFIVFGFFIGFLEKFRGAGPRFYKNENFRMIFDTIILDIIVFLVIIKFLWKLHGKRLRNMGFLPGNIARNIRYGVMAYVGVMPIIFIIGILVYMLLNIFKLEVPPQPIVGLFLSEKNVALVFVSGIIAALFGPVIEEIFFRGVMYSAVRRKLGVFWGIFITSVLFSFLHTHAASYFLVGFVPIAVLGAVLAYLYEKTGSLIPSVTLHVLNNLGSVAMVFIFKYFNNLVG